MSVGESMTGTESWLFFSMTVSAGPYSPHRLSYGKADREKHHQLAATQDWLSGAVGIMWTGHLAVCVQRVAQNEIS